MAIKSMFFNAVEVEGEYDRVYNAEDFTNYLGSLVSDGVFSNPSTNLQVRVGSGLQSVKYAVKPGNAWIKGHLMIVDEDYLLSPTANLSELSRMDRVVAYLDFENRTMGIELKVGTPRSTPESGCPALVRNSERYELGLAKITTPPSVLITSQDKIEDTRGLTNTCGWVTGIVNQVDTTTLFLQYDQAFNSAIARMQTSEDAMAAWMSSMQTQFESWLETLTEQLRIETYIQKFEKTVVAAWGSSDPEIALDMVGYTYDSSDIIMVFINGLKAVNNIDYTIFVSNPTKIILNTDSSTTDDQTVNILVLKSKIGFNTLIDEDDAEIITNDDDNIVV